METQHPPHKLVCILHADVAGYSRLTSEYEDQSFELLQTAIALFSSVLLQHGGQIANRAGDAMLVRFDSAYNAVAGALAAQSALASANRDKPEDRRITLRIGINIGDVVESNDDIFGHGVNVAARIQTLADPGGICVSEPVRLAVPRGSGISFIPIGERNLKNMSEPVQVYKVTQKLAETRSVPPPPLAQTSGMVEHRSPAHVLRRILVLPFTVFSSNPDHAYLADGFCEDLITELSRFRSFAVLARTTAFAFKGTTKTIHEIGKQVSAHYALEGSFRPTGQKLRINAQLIEADREDHVWAEKYDCDLAEIFDAQDTIVAKIAGILENRIVERRLKLLSKLGPQALDAYDCWLKGHALMQSWDEADDSAAMTYFERAIELDPSFARAHGSMAGIHSSRALLRPGNPAIESDIASALRFAETAVHLDPGDGKVHIYLGWVWLLKRDFGRAEAAFETAGACNPNDAEIAISRALAYAYLGEPDRARILADHAFSLNPLYPPYYLGYRASILFLAGNYTDSCRLFGRMPSVRPLDFLAWQAAALALCGDAEGAAAVRREFLRCCAEEWTGPEPASPEGIMAWLMRITPLRRKEDMGRFQDGLRLAGLV